MLGELHHAKTGDTRNFRDIGGHCDIVTILECFEHLIERGRAAFSVEFAVVRAGAADRADAELLRGARIDLAVAVTLIALESDDEPSSVEPAVNESLPIVRRIVEHEDEFGPTREVRSGPRWVDKLLIRLEGVDDFLTRAVYRDEHEIRS